MSGKPVGRSLRWTRADIKALAEVASKPTPLAVAQANAYWKRLAPPKFKRLLDARTINKRGG